MPLSDIMAINIVTVDPGATVSAVATRMVDRRVGSALVCDGPHLLGIVTERDVLRVVASDADPQTFPVLDCMTPSPVSAAPEWEIEDAARVMMKRGIRHLPVTQDGKVAGMVSIRDLLRFGLTATSYGSEGGRRVLEAAAGVLSPV